MPVVEIEMPEITMISYRQCKDNKDYGSCLWARFNFDTKNYHLSIESDCGSYSNGWYPTPNSETFLHLCSRFDQLYLLDKISTRNVVDGDATYKSLIAWMEDYDEYGWNCLSEIQRDEIENACHFGKNDHATLRAISDALADTDFEGSCSDYDIACCIEMTYPRGAMKIAEIFKNHIQPVLRQLVEAERKETKND